MASGFAITAVATPVPHTTPPPLAMRRALPRDDEFVARVFLTTLREAITAARGSWDEQRERAQFQQQLLLGRTEIVELDGVPVGFATLVSRASELQLHTLCIATEYQGRGLGSRVLRSLLNSSLAQGKPVVLAVLKSNPRARALYHRLGFVVVGQSEYHLHLRCAA